MDFRVGDFQGLRSNSLGFGRAAEPMARAWPTFGMSWSLRAVQERIFQGLFIKHFLGLKWASKHEKRGYFGLEGHISDFFEDSKK